MNSPLFKAGRAAASFALAATVLTFAAPAQASLKCQERVEQRACTNNAPQPYEVGPDSYIIVPAPQIDGFDTPCWTWTRKFQCVEANPIYSCESGSDFDTVKDTCNLTAATVNNTATINALMYITDATYTYRCDWGSFTYADELPTGKECVKLSEATTDDTSAPAATSGADPSTGVGNPPLTASMTTTIVTDQTVTEEHVCYSPPATTCTDTCYEQVVDPVSGNIEHKEVACVAPVTNCSTTSDACEGSLALDADGNAVGTLAQGPDGRCVQSHAESLCQNGEVPRCLAQDNCTLQTTSPASVQANGVALSEEQTYICSNTVTSCAQMTSISSCMHVGAWGWDKMELKSEVGTGLGKFNQALARSDAIQKGMNQDDPFIFSGQDRRCNYKVGGWLNTAILVVVAIAVTYMTAGAGAAYSYTLISQTAYTAEVVVTAAGVAQAAAAAGALSEAGNSKEFGKDCCKDLTIQGSDSNSLKAHRCTEDEIKLAVARKKNLHHYLGEYCSKYSGFPVKECKQKTKVYCTFDDMLAMSVNEQGRQQLEAIAQSDPELTKGTGALPFALYGPEIEGATDYSGMNNGRWLKQVASNNSQIWAWQYPGYCRSAEKQKAAFDLWQADFNQAADMTGIQPGTLTAAQADELLTNLVSVPPFQECAEAPGMMAIMTCSKQDDSCNETLLPVGPAGVETDLSGEIVTQSDVNWRIQLMQSFFMPGDYGVTSLMSPDTSYAAVSTGVNEYITATGSCHTDGNCLYQYAITDKLSNNGEGARKRVKERVQFPLYTAQQSASWPTIDYLSAAGGFDDAAYLADPNRTLGTPMTLNSQRFLFHPNSITTQKKGVVHNQVLLDWGTGKQTHDDPDDLDQYEPLLVPTSLPPATEGFYPYGDPTDNDKHFYLSGGCDPNSRWCTYDVEMNLSIPRHPWGSALNPRCWGFSIDQLSALDFDKMDLSKWVASLNLDSATNGLSADAAKSMSDQALDSAQNFYAAFKDGETIPKPNPGQVALMTSADTLPSFTSDEEGSFVLRAAVPANWPQYFDDGLANNNPVTNVWVDWGDGSLKESMLKTTNSRAFDGTHDYGNKLKGTYKLTVTLDTAHNGPQTLTSTVNITPDDGAVPEAPELDFNNPGLSGDSQESYTPSALTNTNSQAPANLGQMSPATVDQFNAQGNTLSAPR